MKNLKISIFQYVFIGLFVLILITPWFDSLLGLKVDVANKEMRTLAAKPELSLQKIFDYPVAFEKYYIDNFGYRNLLVSWGAKIKTNTFNAPIDPTKAVIGKDNWIYLAGEKFNILSDINRWNRFSDVRLKQVAADLEEKNATLNEKGIKFYFCPWPDKHIIYPEYLPDAFNFQTTEQPSRLDQLYEYFEQTKSPVKYVDVRKALLNHKQIQLYLKNDTHWNEYGAFIGYQELMKTISSDFPNARPVRTIDEYYIKWTPSNTGDLLNLLGMSGAEIFTEQRPNFSQKDSAAYHITKIPTEGYPGLSTTLHRNDSCGNKLRVLVFRDSYTGAVIPFFSTNFYEVLYIWCAYDQSVVDRFKPDIVVESFASRFAFY